MVSKTRWDKIVSGKELSSARAQRSKAFILSKERRSSLQELLDEGWEFHKDYKDPKFVSVKKMKPVDEQFEDRVWLLFAKMGFTHMNCDRNFEMSYDYQNPDFTQQIDVFAADEESVIIVECKAAETLKDGVFKKNIEALHGQMDGLAKAARKQFPGRKAKIHLGNKELYPQQSRSTETKRLGNRTFWRCRSGLLYGPREASRLCRKISTSR